MEQCGDLVDAPSTITNHADNFGIFQRSNLLLELQIPCLEFIDLLLVFLQFGAKLLDFRVDNMLLLSSGQTAIGIKVGPPIV